MLQVRPWPHVILHLDGDAFFASVIQATHPAYKGRPLVAGRERGMAIAVSYEAKKYGIKRCMLVSQVKKLCPECIVMDSDYELYDIYSQKMFSILRSFTPYVEEYSIDEGFADIKGLQRPLNMNYSQIAKTIQDKIVSSLGIGVSVGVSITKSLAKLASNKHKPLGLVVVDGLSIENLLCDTLLIDVWGIGPNTSSYLQKLGLKTALDFVKKPENFIKSNLSKPYYEIWKELRGEKLFSINVESKSSYKSMGDTSTFYPPTDNSNVLWSRLLNHIETVFAKARRYHYHVGRVSLFLKTQTFQYHTITIQLKNKTAYPLLIRDNLKQSFISIYKKNVLYRATGCYISNFEENTSNQMGLFQSNQQNEEKVEKIYPIIEEKNIEFGSSLFYKEGHLHREKEKKIGLPLVEL